MNTKRLPQDNSNRESDSSQKSEYKSRRLSKGDGLNIGLTIGATMTIFVIGGNWLDKKLQTGALFTLLGAAFALFSIVAFLLRIGKQ